MSEDDKDPTVLAGLLSLVSGLGITAAVASAVKNQVASRATQLGGYLLLVFGTVVGGWIATEVAIAGFDDTRAIGFWTAVGLMIFYAIANPDWWSMAPFYRGRLRTVYAIRRPLAGEGGNPSVAEDWSGAEEPALSDDAFRAAELHPQFCAAVQVRDDMVQTHATIPALSLTMSTDAFTVHLPTIGGRDGGELSCTTEQFSAAFRRSGNPKVSTMFAVGVSGAAANPSMGRLSMGSTRALLAFANVRLGIWVPNPRWARLIPPELTAPERRVAYPRPRLSYLAKEMFGLHDLKDVYVHAADGGHWENTAITELLRQPLAEDELVTEVLALDASGGKPASVVGPSEAISLAGLEYGRTIDMDLESVRAEADGTRGSGWAPRRATVGLIRQGDEVQGVLWYTRAALTEQHSTLLQAYAERDEVFPGDSTINQFFDVERYEAYRRLGNENVAHVLELREALIDALAASESLEELRALAAEPDASYAVVEVARLLRTKNDFEYLKRRRFAPHPDESPDE